MPQAWAFGRGARLSLAAQLIPSIPRLLSRPFLPGLSQLHFSLGPFLLFWGFSPLDCTAGGHPSPGSGFALSVHNSPLGLTQGCWWSCSTTAFPGSTRSLSHLFPALSSFHLYIRELTSPPTCRSAAVPTPHSHSRAEPLSFSFSLLWAPRSFDLTCLAFSQRRVKGH